MSFGFLFIVGLVLLAAFLLVGACYLALRGRWRDTLAESAQTDSPRPAEPADPREDRIHQAAFVVRQVLLRLADAIRHMDTAADLSCVALQEARRNLSQTPLGNDFAEAQTRVLGEVDRLISSNHHLRSELAGARTTLAEQEKEIESLRTAVRTDLLTGLPNRVHFAEHLREAFDKFRRYQEAFSLLLLDIDHFKAINDSHGHPAGDRVLKGLSARLRTSFRGVDFVCRFGGEEFAAILPKTALAESRDVAERVRTDVQETVFRLDAKVLHSTISIGAAEAKAGDTAESLIKRADDALYQAKQSGRDRVVLSGETPAAIPERKTT